MKILKQQKIEFMVSQQYQKNYGHIEKYYALKQSNLINALQSRSQYLKEKELGS